MALYRNLSFVDVFYAVIAWNIQIAASSKRTCIETRLKKIIKKSFFVSDEKDNVKSLQSGKLFSP